MAGLKISTVDNKSSLNEFVEFPFELYRGDPHFVPQLRIAVKELLDKKKHPFYKDAETQLFVARRDDKVVGRIAAIINRAHDRYHGEKAGFFGFFECIDDQQTASLLLNQAHNWVRDRGAEFMRGPVNPSTNYEAGLLIEGFDFDPMVMMTYNPPYYQRLIEKAGLTKAKDLYAYLSHAQRIEMKKIDRVASKALQSTGVTIRPINMKDFANEVGRVWEVYGAATGAWAKNWGFVPMSREEFAAMGKEMKMIVKPELVLIGEKAGKTVGFALALPDVNQALKPAGGSLFPTGLLKILYHQRLIKSVRVLALGVIEEYRTTGLAAGFYATLVQNARKLGFGDCEMSWILEDNVLMNRSLEVMGAKRYKTYRLYDWN